MLGHNVLEITAVKWSEWCVSLWTVILYLESRHLSHVPSLQYGSQWRRCAAHLPFQAQTAAAVSTCVMNVVQVARWICRSSCCKDHCNSFHVCNECRTGSTLDMSFKLLHEAQSKLRNIIHNRFDSAVRSGDAASVERFFKTFPLIGEHKAGLEKFSKYLCTQVCWCFSVLRCVNVPLYAGVLMFLCTEVCCFCTQVCWCFSVLSRECKPGPFFPNPGFGFTLPWIEVV